MAYESFDYQRPDPTAESGLEAFSGTRQNLLALRDAVMMGAMAGWSMTPSGGSPAQPAKLTYARGPERIELGLTWGDAGGTDGNPTAIAFRYSNDSGNNWQDIGNEHITYDSAGNVTGTSWS